jgi:hypothetical protein
MLTATAAPGRVNLAWQDNSTNEAGFAVERRKVQRRRQIDPTTCERDYNDDEIEFMQAMDAYKRASGRMFPTCSEVLEVVRSLGYVKLSAAELATLPEGGASTASAKPMPEDWGSPTGETALLAAEQM